MQASKKPPPHVWKGWQSDTLHAWKAPTSTQCVAFLNIWAQCVEQGTKLNPLGASQPEHGSSDYKGDPPQNYPTKKAALAAYRTQIADNAFSHLRAAIMGGDPIAATGDNTHMKDELKAWGVDWDKFSKLLSAVTQGPPKATPGVHPPKGVSSAWRNMLRFYSRDVPKKHGEAAKLAKSYRHIFK